MNRAARLLRRYWGRWLCGLALTVTAALSTLGYLHSDAIERMDGFLSGLRMRIEAPRLDARIVIVDIDEKSLAAVGRFPWSRDIQARLVTQLTRHYEVGAVGFDISFPEPDTSSGYAVLERLAHRELDQVAGLKEQLALLKAGMDYDGLLAEALRGQPVVLGYNVSEKLRKGVLPAPAFTLDSLNGRELLAYSASGYEANIARLQQAAAGAGIFTAFTDADGVIRSSILLQRIGDAYYPSLSLATAAVYLKARAIAPYFDTTVDQLSQAQKDSGSAAQIALFLPQRQLRIPVGEGLTTYVQYRGRGGPAGGAFRYVPAADVLSGAAPLAQLKGALVLVGSTAPGINDLRVTPVNPEYPGVEVHANLLKSILDNDFKARPAEAYLLESLLVLAFGLVLSLALAPLAPLKAVALATLALAGALGANLLLYREAGMVLNAAVPVLLIVALFVMNLAVGYVFEVRKGQALVSLFGEYVAPELVADMADNPGQYTMDGATRELTVLFADVRGFTGIAEQLEPTALREYINLYLTAMSEDIRDSHRGTLDKYIGDAVMAFWGAPVAFADHASRAVASALLMQASAARLDAQFRARGWPALAIGIGINSGQMHVGDMGSAIRRAYTVMGDAVNLGARLEGLSKVYGAGIVAGAATRLAAPEFAWRELDLVRVKGKLEPVAIFEPLGHAFALGDDAVIRLAAWHEALALVRARQWDGAQAILAGLRAGEDCVLYRLYLDRIARYRADPPGPDWDGVTIFDTK
ncbi:MAG TPA: adenylate/guanylate cyclase domain-containing protein [Telluria sp.]|jgi:adenylate cyclase